MENSSTSSKSNSHTTFNNLGIFKHEMPQNETRKKPVASTNLFKDLIFLSSPSFFYLAPTTFLSLPDSPLSLGQHGERVNAPLFLKSDELLAKEIKHVGQSGTFNLSYSLLHK